MKRRVSFIILASLFLLYSQQIVKVEAYKISYTVDLDPTSVEEGHIISYTQEAYKLTDSRYSKDIIGVVTENPEIAMVGRDQLNFVHIATIGNTRVKVSAINGEIQSGDYITSSELPGVGMKATESGYMVGRALEGFTPQNEDEQGTILISLDVRDATISTEYSRNLITLLQKGTAGAMLYPVDALRYLLAALLVAASFILGLFSFTRIAVNSVQAIGRNPVAHEYIKKETKSSFMLTTVVILVGLGIAYLVLAL